MEQFNTLNQIIQLHPLIIGIGNTIRGDDAAGILLTRHLQSAGYSPVLIVEGNPENYLGKISTLPGSARLWVDVVNFGGESGDWRVFRSHEIDHFAISTHNFSLSVLFNYLKTLRPVPDYCLGIQPHLIELGETVSPAVRKTVSELAKHILAQTGNRREASRDGN